MTEIILIIALSAIWIVLLGFIGLTLVKTGSIAVVFRFGKFVRVMKPGLNFRIPIVETIEVYSTQTHQVELPADADMIDRINEIPEAGKKLPFRILMKGKREAIFYVKKAKDDSTIQLDEPVTEWNLVPYQELDETMRKNLEEDSLHAPLTGEVSVVVEWYLKDDMEVRSIKDFIQNIIPEGERHREEEVRKRIEDMASRALQELLGSITLGHAQVMVSLFSQLVKRRIEILVGEEGEGDRPWGIHIRDAYVKSISPGRRVNEARADAASAVAKKQEGLLDAERLAVATRLQADADEYSERRKGEGEAARIASMAQQMESETGRFIATLDVADTALRRANFAILPGDIGVLGSILKLGHEVVKSGKIIS